MDVKGTVHPDHISVLILVVAMVVDLYTTYIALDGMDLLDLLMNLIPPLAYGIGASILLFSEHKDASRSFIICSVSYSIAYIATSLTVILGSFEIFSTDPVIFGHVVLMIAIGAAIIANIAFYARGLSPSTTVIRYAIIISLAVEILFFIINVRSFSDDMELVMGIYWDSLPLYIMGVYILILMRFKGVKTQTILYSIRQSMMNIRTSNFLEGIRMDRSTVTSIKDLDGSNLWCDRYECPLNSFSPEDYRMVMVREDGKTHVMISNMDDLSGVNGYRFNLAGVWTDDEDASRCDIVRLYDEEGFFVQFIVSESYVDRSKKRTLSECMGISKDDASCGNLEPDDDGEI